MPTRSSSHANQAKESALQKYSNPEEYIAGDQFDWKTIKVLCVSGIPKHKAYGMNFDQYRKQREMVTNDTTEKKRLTYYLPTFPSMLSTDFAEIHNVSIHKFTLLTLELGLIHFQHDYYDTYQSVKKARGQSVIDKVSSDSRRNVFVHLNGCSISLGSCAGAADDQSRRASVNTPEWFYNALTDTAKHLNMTISDMVYLCWCIGITKCVIGEMGNDYLMEEFGKIIQHFESELFFYVESANHLIEKITDRA
jgi:hypothetical protein